MCYETDLTVAVSSNHIYIRSKAVCASCESVKRLSTRCNRSPATNSFCRSPYPNRSRTVQTVETEWSYSTEVNTHAVETNCGNHLVLCEKTTQLGGEDMRADRHDNRSVWTVVGIFNV